MPVRAFALRIRADNIDRLDHAIGRARTDLRMRVRALGEVHVAFLVRLHAGVESMTAVRLPQVVVRGRAFLANGALAFDKLEGAGRMRVVAARLEPVAALGHLFDGHSEDCSLR